MFETGN